MSQNMGWEKDINNFINIYETPNFSIHHKDYSLLKKANIVNTKDGITVVVDVWYKNNCLQVMTTGTVKSVGLISNDKSIIHPSENVLDPHNNVNLYKFNIDYSKDIQLSLEYWDKNIKDEKIITIQKNYYADYPNENIISAIANTSFNDIKFIYKFCKYHLNLGYDRIILHDVGPKIHELYDMLREYIEINKVILIEWNIGNFFQKLRTSNTHRTNVGDTSQMNHSLWVFKNSKSLTILNTDEYVAINKKSNNIGLYLDELKNKYNAHTAGGFDIKVLDFKEPEEDVEFYKSHEIIKSRAGTYGLDHKNLIFPNNVNSITCHSITSGHTAVDVGTEDLVLNHYHFLYTKQDNSNVIDIIDNIESKLFD